MHDAYRYRESPWIFGLVIAQFLTAIVFALCDSLQRVAVYRASRGLDLCRSREWSMHWTARGAYLHLEVSELIEAIRGKHGSPLHEAADVLIVLMSITQNQNISWQDVLTQASMKVSEMMMHKKANED